MCLPACHAVLARFASRRSFVLGGLGVVAASAGGAPPSTQPPTFRLSRIVDLTHTLDPDFPTFSGQSQFSARTLASLQVDGWNVREWCVNEHTGTHLDAPFHRSQGPSADLIPPSALVGPLAVIDIRERAAANPDAQVIPNDLRNWESRHGRLPEGSIVAMLSGWDLHARTPRFRSADDRGVLHFPGFHEESVAWLLETRSIHGIVVDTLSLDHGPSQDFPTHSRWLGAGRWGLECASRLDQVPPVGATIVVGAPKVAGATGGPSRVLALV